MANSMDGILVKYGVSLSKEEQDLIEWTHWVPKKKKKAEELKGQIKTLKIPEFLAINPDELSETERNIQRAIQLVYDLNDKDPPLYKEFPSFRSDKEPLTIDITTAGKNEQNYAAAFGLNDNRVTFESIDDPDLLVLTLAHELKHAEQCDEEAYEWYGKSLNGMRMENAYGWHQRNFIDESRAFLEGARAYYKIFGHTDNPRMPEVRIYEEVFKEYGKILDPKQFDEEAVKAIFNRLLLSGKHFEYYKDKYDLRAPIGETDKGLDNISEVFQLSQNLLSEFQKIPRKARTLNAQLLQAAKNGEIDTYVDVLHKGADKNEEMPAAWFWYVCENGSVEQIKDVANLKTKDNQYLFNSDAIKYGVGHVVDRDCMQYLLSLQRDEKPFIDTETIIYQLNNKKTLEELKLFIQLVQDENGYLPLSEKDCINQSDQNEILRYTCFTEEDRSALIQNLPQILKLKGKDGKNLVGEKHLSKELGHWIRNMKTLENLEALLKGITDENGKLPVSREFFDIRNSEWEHMNGQNDLLVLFSYTDEEAKYSEKIIPTLKSLKDKDGKLIISQENIDKFPESDKLAQAVKGNKKPSKLKLFLKKYSEKATKPQTLKKRRDNTSSRE